MYLKIIRIFFSTCSIFIYLFNIYVDNEFSYAFELLYYILTHYYNTLFLENTIANDQTIFQYNIYSRFNYWKINILTIN